VTAAHQIKVFIVLPCFNEEDNLIETLSTLGFSQARAELYTDVNLIIVDNNSTDATYYIANKMRDCFPYNVHLIKESEQGYVPPRHKGNLYAKDIAEKNHWSIDEVLIIQADADTHYSQDYIIAMRNASSFWGLNTLLEAYSKFPLSFEQKYPDYIDICIKSDMALNPLFVKSKTYDVIVDDKQCAYRLGDYFRWGMHVREFLTNGDELFAETTRLFIKARETGARKVMLNNAYAEHSPRRILETPLLQYITAGFPREFGWKKKWLDIRIDLTQFVELELHNHKLWKEASRTRTIHLIALFIISPLYINNILRVGTNTRSNSAAEQILKLLPLIDKETLVANPGQAIYNVLETVEQYFNDTDDLITHLIN